MIFIKKNIVLIGMTGVGKTTVGKVLSSKLKKEFWDSDHQIELASGYKISDFFSRFGESEFRKLEKKIFFRIINTNSKAIISTGAGLFSDTEILNLVLNKTICIFLNAKIRTIHERLKNNVQSRPKLSKGNLLKKIQRMHKKRFKNYNLAHIKFDVDDLSFLDIVSDIINNLKEYEKP